MERVRLLRFGPFELDCRAAELRKHDLRIRLQEQPFQILLMLLTRPGEVVLREELRKRLWPNDTIVEFDHSINAAIKRLRDALGESAENPRYVETVARRGYRFIGEVQATTGEPLIPAVEPKPEPEPATGDLTGRTVSHYRVLARVGAGGMGEVYRARDTRLGRDVALKALPAEFAQDASRRERFEREAHAVAALNHANIVALFDIGSENGVTYMVTEFVEGETLRSAQFPPRKAIEIAAQVADGLAAAHTAGVTHRDIKPDNVMVTPGGRAKILDFGLARVTSELGTDASTRTEAGTVMGTVGYMSPEQVRGADVDPRSDIFSFGTLLYELVSGKRAFQGDSAVEVMNAILQQDPPELSESTPSGVREIVAHCLEKRPEERFQSAQDLAFALRAVSVRSTASLDALPPALTANIYRRVLLWTLAALLVGSLVTGFGVVRWAASIDSSFDPIRLTRFAGELGDEVFPAFSPDGRSVAYQRMLPTTREIVVQPLDSPTPVTLVRSPTLSFRSPIWNPDGSRVCYVVEPELWCVGAAGGTPQPLLSNVGSGDFTPDGKSLIFFRVEPPRRLYISSPPGAAPKPLDLAQLPESVGVPQLGISPDGTKLLVVTSTPGVGSGQAWMVPYPSGTPKPVPNPDHAQIMAARWFPDSRHVALSEILPRVTSFRLVIADTRSVNRRLVVPDTGQIRSADVSPDGRRILYSTGQPNSDVVEYSMDGKHLVALAASSNQEINPMWSPLGDRFVYTVLTSSGNSWWTRRADGSGASLLSAHALGGWPRYSPDGRRIAYVTSPLVSNNPGIETIPAEGGTAVRIITSQAGQNLCWSPDGEWLWYGLNGKLWKVPSQGGQAAVIADRAGTLLDCSADGRWIAYVFPDGVHLISSDGTQDHVLTSLANYGGSNASFGEGGKAFYLLRNNLRAMDVLDVATGKVRRTIDFELPSADTIGWFSIHPDGKRILFQSGAFRFDLWMAEGFAQPARGWKSWLRHWQIPEASAAAGP